MSYRRVFTVILATGFLANLGMAVHRGVFTNFAAGELGMGPGQFGLLEGVRELPGLLTIVLAAATARISEERLYALCVALIGGGVWLYATANSFGDLITATLVYSVGFHLWFVIQDAMVMKGAQVEERALRLGQVTSAAAAAALGGMGLVWLLGAHLSLRQFFVVGGVAALAGGVIALGLRRPAGPVARRAAFVFRWEYRSYYFLTLLSGARRHMVITFATFALVRLFGTPVQTMALLMAAHSLLAVWTRPFIGRIIDRLGEQKALAFNYAVITLVFIGYAFIRQPWVFFGLYIVDQVFWGFDIAISTHAGRIVPRAELGPSLAMGSTINHIFGVSVPMVGGLLWEAFGPLVPFLTGAAVTVIAMVYSLGLDRRQAAAGPPVAAD